MFLQYDYFSKLMGWSVYKSKLRFKLFLPFEFVQNMHRTLARRKDRLRPKYRSF